MKSGLVALLCISILFCVVGCDVAPADPSESERTSPKTDTPVSESAYPQAHVLTLCGNTATLDETALTEYDYVWHADPSHAEPYYTGTEPADTTGAYIAHDIVYYPAIDTENFRKETYDGETEWVTHYTAAGMENYLFSTLPVLGADLPTQMMHTADEAYQNPVLHITQAGEYLLRGNWNGQIWVDLGDPDETAGDETAKVTLILDGVDIECTVAPAVVFYSVYECDNTWEERTTYNNTVDLTDAGAQILVTDGTENAITGTNVFRLLKATYKSDESTVQKKRWKMDGALYSFVSLRIDGETAKTGILNIRSTTYEGLDSELHLTIDGGYLTIVSEDDGINVNEDGVSVFTMNGGHLTIFAGQGAEGDVVDSNGYIMLNGGWLAGASPSVSDDILDSDSGTTVSENATVIRNTNGIDRADMGRGAFPNGPQDGGMPPPEPPQ